jgi:ADP-ribose pyrophosphatase YjhB (NUDIX family)
MAFGYRVFAPIGWGFAGGMIESGEDAKANSEKEIDEEMNIRPQDVISSTSLGNYDVEEVRGTANTALFRLEVTEERMRALEAGSDVEETMILDKKELEEFLKTRSNEMVPHHLDMLIEQARMGNIPSWASTVITGVFPEDNNKRSK